MIHTERTVIVLHGALGSAAQMAPVVNALGPLGRVRAFEFPGHGHSPGGSVPFTIAGFTDWLLSALEPVTTAPPVVLGYSMGGYVALALESRRPGTFAGIATLGTKFAWSPEAATRDGARLDADVIRAKVPRFAAALESRHVRAGGWEQVLRNTASLLAALGADPPLDARSLANVRARVVLGVGDADDTVDAAETATFAAMIPGATTCVLPGTPHPIERVASAEVVALVQAVSGG
jgi:pimeloyl-ACP methyl ester carboxylesterase